MAPTASRGVGFAVLQSILCGLEIQSVRVYTYIGHQYLAATFSTSVLELVSAHSLYSMIRDDLKLLDDGGEIPKS